MVKSLKNRADWDALFSEYARITIQVQMKKQDLGYRELTALFNERFALNENERNMRNKIARGTFSASFFLMCMHAMGCHSIDIGPDEFRENVREQLWAAARK